jgi:hypothetical protein
MADLTVLGLSKKRDGVDYEISGHVLAIHHLLQSDLRIGELVEAQRNAILDDLRCWVRRFLRGVSFEKDHGTTSVES